MKTPEGTQGQAARAETAGMPRRLGIRRAAALEEVNGEIALLLANALLAEALLAKQALMQLVQKERVLTEMLANGRDARWTVLEAPRIPFADH